MGRSSDNYSSTALVSPQKILYSICSLGVGLGAVTLCMGLNFAYMLYIKNLFEYCVDATKAYNTGFC